MIWGVHTFYHTNKCQRQEKVSGTYKFVHVGQPKDGSECIFFCNEDNETTLCFKPWLWRMP
jgi:hypothetical protein